MGPGLSLGASDLARPLVGPRCQPVKAGLARGPCSDTLGSPGRCSLYQRPASGDSSPGHLSRGAFGSLVAALSGIGSSQARPRPFLIEEVGSGRPWGGAGRGPRAVSLSSSRLRLWGAFPTKVTKAAQPPSHESDLPGVCSGQRRGRGR